MLECVVNISEGRDQGRIEAIASAAGADLLDVHTDADHHRSVLTLVGEAAPRAVARAAVEVLDLRRHEGAHPRIGVVDVVPFVPLHGARIAEAVAARDRFAAWAASELGVPSFLYGPLGAAAAGDPGWGDWSSRRTLPEVRRGAFESITPDAGPLQPHPTAGAMAVGARPFLVAYNLWLTEPDLALARDLAAALRSPHVRALGLAVGSQVQVSMNLIAPQQVGPAAVWDLVASRAAIERAELVGLVPEAVLAAVDEDRWSQLDLSPDRTIEARLRGAGAR